MEDWRGFTSYLRGMGIDGQLQNVLVEGFYSMREGFVKGESLASLKEDVTVKSVTASLEEDVGAGLGMRGRSLASLEGNVRVRLGLASL